MVELLLGILPGAVQLDLHVQLLPNFRGTAILISRVVVLFAISSAMEECSPHPCQHVLSLEFLISAILIVVRFNLRVFLICISLMTKMVEHSLPASRPAEILLLRKLVIVVTEHSLFSCVPHFQLRYLFFLESTFLSSLYILDISSL